MHDNLMIISVPMQTVPSGMVFEDKNVTFCIKYEQYCSCKAGSAAGVQL